MNYETVKKHVKALTNYTEQFTIDIHQKQLECVHPKNPYFNDSEISDNELLFSYNYHGHLIPGKYRDNDRFLRNRETGRGVSVEEIEKFMKKVDPQRYEYYMDESFSPYARENLLFAFVREIESCPVVFNSGNINHYIMGLSGFETKVDGTTLSWNITSSATDSYVYTKDRNRVYILMNIDHPSSLGMGIKAVCNLMGEELEIDLGHYHAVSIGKLSGVPKMAVVKRVSIPSHVANAAHK